MARIAFRIFLLLFSGVMAAQSGFTFDTPGKSKVTIPFQLINNLLFVPVNVNGVDLTFLVDTGVDETILFSLDDREEIVFSNVEKIFLKGLGSSEAIEGLKSAGNKMVFPGFSDNDHDIYIVLNQNFNFSSSIGIPVHGILGYHFFKNHLIEINYHTKKLTIHSDNKKMRKRLTDKYALLPVTIENRKPYITTDIALAGDPFNAKLLIDLGNSDAVWLFTGKSPNVKLPQLYFEDYLGRGFSGDIHGNRARLETFKLGEFNFTKVLGAFPDSSSTKDITMVDSRIGSLGGEILKRFSVVFDYPGNRLYLRKNADFNEPFHYNMSGLEIHHDGVTWVKETVELNTITQTEYDRNGERIPNSFTYKFQLKPIYSVTNVRKDSPAEISGVQKGDVIIAINGRLGYRFTLQQINTMLKSEEGKEIELDVERDKKPMRFSFRLKSIL